MFKTKSSFALPNLRNERGNAILMVLGLIAVLGVSALVVAGDAENNQLLTTFVQKRKRNFYVIESSRTLMTAAAQEYLANTIAPTEDGLKTHIATKLEATLPVEYTYDSLDVEIQSMPTVLPIPSGPFVGMLAPQATVRFKYRIKSVESGENQTSNLLDTTISLAQVGMFQFTYFLDLPYVDWFPGPVMAIDGRTHINGDFCAAGQLGLTFQRLTASGRIMHGNDLRCRRRVNYPETYVSHGTTLAQRSTLLDNGDNDCVNCNSTTLSWRAYALTRWNGNLQDQAHAVNRLSLPRPSVIYAQYGFNDQYYNGWLNNTNLRFTLDPVLTIDEEATKKMKFAYRAHVRIIDGVWYLKNPANANDWPGIPIWSDHPGTFTDSFGKQVGQTDIKAYWQAQGRPWAGTPRRYSFYEYNNTNKSIAADALGVVSYGNLFRDTSSGVPRWIPGHFLEDDVVDGGGSITTRVKSLLCGSTGTANALTSPASGFRNALTPLACQSATPSIATSIINATRSGMRDGHLQQTQLNERTDLSFLRAAMIPMNFSVQDFQDALSDATAGELGSYFGSSRFMTEDFNGIVWVSSRWPGSENGYSGGAPEFPPYQYREPGAPLGSSILTNNDTTQIGVTHNTQQRAIPYPLCTQAESGPDDPNVPNPGDPLDRSGGSSRFEIPNCNTYRPAGTIGAFPSVVRVTNARTLNKAILQNGLSVVSNLPIYVLGTYNSTSTASAPDSTWVPSLIAGDTVTVLSDNWTDEFSRWNNSTHEQTRLASDTTYNTAIQTGFARNPTDTRSQATHALPTLMEDWRTRTLTINGSIVVGHYPVYARNFVHYTSTDFDYTYASGTRMISFDPHLQFIANQPPGSSMFFISSVLNWKID